MARTRLSLPPCDSRRTLLLKITCQRPIEFLRFLADVDLDRPRNLTFENEISLAVRDVRLVVPDNQVPENLGF